MNCCPLPTASRTTLIRRSRTFQRIKPWDGSQLEGMETRHVNFHTPVESPAAQEGNPAKREDPGRPVRKRSGHNCRGTTRTSWRNRALCMMPRRTAIIVPWDACWATNRPNARKGGRRGTSIGAGTARNARWRRCAAIKTPSEGEAFRGTSPNPCGSGCTPRCRPKRHGRSTTDRCASGETPFAIIKTSEVRRFSCRAGEGPHGMALGVYGLQPEETDVAHSGKAPRANK